MARQYQVTDKGIYQKTLKNLHIRKKSFFNFPGY